MSVAGEQQITERFTRAIDQLGSENMAVRLGGIYALERIAKDSDKDHWQVMEVLTAYVRENAGFKGEYAGGVPVSDELELATDIQAILTVQGRRNANYDKPGQYLDLRRTNLGRANLADANLQSANLADTNLQGAYLADTNLQGAYLAGTNLQKTYLIGANLQGADLNGANLRDAHGLTKEQLESARTDDKTVRPDDL